MKQLLLIFLLCMGMAQPSPAQQYFNLRNSVGSFSSILSGVVVRDNKFYCSSVVVDSTSASGKSGNKFLVFDNFGNKILDTIYQLSNRNIETWNNSFQSIPDGGFLLVTESVDTAKFYAMILRYDSLGKVLMSKEIAKPFCTSREWMKVIDIKAIESSQWLMLSRISCGPAGALQHDIVITKMDSNFNVVWHKQYGDAGLDDIGWKLLIEPYGY